MSRRTRFLLCLTLLCVAVSASACGTPPTREMDQAQGALDAARAAGADRYAADEYKAAATALNNARDAVAQRDYRLALNHALDSRERAQAAAKQAADQQAAQRSAAERRLGEVTALSDLATRKLTAARTARVPAHLLVSPRSAIAAGDTSLHKAGTLITSGDYSESQKQLVDATAQLRAAIAQVDALTAGRGSRPRR